MNGGLLPARNLASMRLGWRIASASASAPVRAPNLAALLQWLIAEIKMTPIDGVRDKMPVDLSGGLARLTTYKTSWLKHSTSLWEKLVAPAGFEPATQGL